MIPASKHLATFAGSRTRYTPRGSCTATGGWMPETFCGFQLVGEVFLLTSFFIEPKGCRFESYLRSQILSLRTPTPCWLTPSVFFRLARYPQLLHTFPADP